MAKEKKEEPKGFWVMVFSDDSVEVFDSKKEAKKMLRKWAKHPDEGDRTFPMYLHGPVIYLGVKGTGLVSINETGEGYKVEDLVD